MQRDSGGRRSSRLRDGVTLLYADLHNHTLMSDGAGDPATAFAQIRAAGLDVAALTDHASIPRHAVAHLDPRDYPHRAALRLAQAPPDSLDAAAWARTAALADAADEPGRFTALRGFEWTEPFVGHANVWFSDTYRDVHVPGRVRGLHDWLLAEAPGALFGYNHPGREAGRFDSFAHDIALTDRMVSLELFNRHDDYLCVDGRSPLVDCLAAGWRPGLVGVSDEHGTQYGLRGKGRTGMWAGEHSRAGVRDALLDRATYATREAGLLLDATLDGVVAGRGLRTGGTATLAVDVDNAEGTVAGEVLLQVLGLGEGGQPWVLAEEPAVLGRVTELAVRPEAAPWLVLRVAEAARGRSPLARRALAYGSPWWLERVAAPAGSYAPG